MKTYFGKVLVFTPKVHRDNRGHFFQSFDKEMTGYIQQEFIQDNQSYSHKSVIRGLHYQYEQPQGKLVRVVNGAAIDFFVDIRKDSPTYGQYDCVELDTINNRVVWIPPGFAHGFATLKDDTVLLYKCTTYYNKEGESGIDPFDKDIGIEWPYKRDQAIFSERDSKLQSFSEYGKDIKFDLLERK
jgi:dTDP-4-dehydrorhamnose 3,5-epimerase